MQQFFLELFDYNNQMNSKLIESFQNNELSVLPKAISLFSHILNAHHIWNNRIKQTSSAYEVWQLHAVHDFKKINETNNTETLVILQTCSLNEIIHYCNTKGEKFNNQIRDILFHVINHSNYHRAQIGTEFRNSNLTPLTTDYIFYKR